MSEWTLKTPVALIIFNRPETTARVLDAIRQVRPPKLFVSADGPRPQRPDDQIKCAKTRAVIETVDWDCEVFTNYSEINLGCGLGEAAGFNWVFEHVPEAIFLEDDTLPHPDFFRFCQELLEKYRDDDRVMHISGTNLLFREENAHYSYRFSRYPFCWGWASWRRAWQHYDLQIKRLPEIIDGGWLDRILSDERSVEFWVRNFRTVHNQSNPHTWDYQWILALWLQNGLSIIPRENLVTNIGFGYEATHTLGVNGIFRELFRRYQFLSHTGLPQVVAAMQRNRMLGSVIERMSGSRFSNVPSGAMGFPLNHPPFFVRDVEADDALQRNNYEGGRLGALKRRVRDVILGEERSG